MAFKMNTIKTDLRSYPPYIIMGLHKIGKTTLFRDLVLHVFGDESKGLLISFGDEEGYLSLDKLQFEKTIEWDAYEDPDTGLRGFVQIIDDLIINKEKYGIEMIALDTFDKMVEVAMDEVFKEHRRLKGVMPKSINDALGGYGAGGRRLSALMQEQVSRLRDAGYAVFILAHTKIKDKTDPLSGEAYEQITNNLQSNFYNTFANTAQMIVNIVVERDIKDGKQIGEKRMMHFRDNGIVDAGSRFNNLPDKLELSAENFMVAFEEGVRNSKLGDKNLTDAEIKKSATKENTERERLAKVAQAKEMSQKNSEKDEENKAELIAKIQAIDFSSLTKEQTEDIKKIVTKKKITKITDSNNSLEDLRDIATAMGIA